MIGLSDRPLNRLEQALPEGILADTAWLKSQGFSRQLLSHYVRSGWLEQPARGVYRRPRGKVSWQQAVVSLQSFLELPLAVGGRTALELNGYAHYLPQALREITLYGAKLPGWVNRLGLKERFCFRNSGSLFRTCAGPAEFAKLAAGRDGGKDAGEFSLMTLPWGQWDWKLILSTPERAFLELLGELPDRETFHQADMLMQGMTNLSPRRLKKLLGDCKTIKVKRLFFFFADRHNHAWLKPLKAEEFDLGAGKRMLVKHGRLDHKYQITVPRDLDAHF